MNGTQFESTAKTSLDELIIDNSHLTTLSFPSLVDNPNISILNNSSLNAVAFPVLTTANITVSSNQKLVNFSVPAVTFAPSITFTVNPSLPSISFNSLTASLSLDFENNAALASVSLPVFKETNSIVIQSNGGAFSSLILPLLINIQTLALQNNPGLRTVSLPALTIAGNFTIYSDVLTSLSLPVLTMISGGLMLWPGMLTSLSLPALTTAGYLQIYNLTAINTTLSSINFPVLTSLSTTTLSAINSLHKLTSINVDNLTSANANFSIAGNLLPSSQINYLLNKFVNITPPIANKLLLFYQFVAAPPTGQGIIDKAILTARPNTVQTD